MTAPHLPTGPTGPRPPGSEPPVTVMCVDDNVMLGKALGRCIDGEPTLKWLGAISDGAQAVAAARRLTPDVILMDIDMPGFNTFSIVEEISTSLPATRVIMLSGHVDRDYLQRSLDAGAWGYLSKAEETAILIDGIHRAFRGEIVLGKEVQALQRRTDHA